MALGQAIKQGFKVIKNNPDPTIVDLGFTDVNDECCFSPIALAQIDGTDDLKNDQKSFLFFFDNAFTGAIMILQKYVGGEWDDVVVLSNSDYGTFYDYGFKVNSKGENLIGYLIDWKLVLELQGEGKYRARAVGDTIFGGEVERLTMDFCLYTYSEAWAQRTVRINFWSTGITGDTEDKKKTKDYSDLTWFDQIRLPDSTFGNNKSDAVREFTRYQNGKQVWTKDNQVEKYTLESGRFPFYFHEYLRVDMFQADEIDVTVYDALNPIPNVYTPVVQDSGYEPDWTEGTMMAKVELKFSQGYENFRHKRC